MMATRTYLEMIEPSALRPIPAPHADCSINRHVEVAPELWRHLYSEVGRAYHWVDRLPWSDDGVRAYFADPAVSLWTLSERGELAGYFELRGDDTGDVEIAYFGLLPAFTGRGLGGYLLSEAVTQAWTGGARRVWVHTSSLDHPAALPNYLNRGFRVFKTEEYETGERGI
jgi:GNAT superfamily N-acetyltransferase